MSGAAPLATITTQEWPMVVQQADMLVKTGFLPQTIKTKEQAVAIMMKGRELGVPPMYALSNIAVISGKPACTAELMLALLYRDHGDGALQVVETTGTRCVAAYKRRGWKEAQTFAFTIEDARTAGLQGGNWAKYPAAMLRARCISAIARMAFPDSIGGMYTAEELGAAVNGETGEIVAGPSPAHLVSEINPGPVVGDEPDDGPEPVAAMAVATQREPEVAVAVTEEQHLRRQHDQLRERLREYGTVIKALPPDAGTIRLREWVGRAEHMLEDHRIAEEDAKRAAKAEIER